MADPAAFFELLYSYDVKYVIIDKIAAALHGVPVLAESTAIFPECTPENNEKLAEALQAIDAVVQLEHGTGSQKVTAELLASGWRQLPMGKGHRFVTSHGITDIVYLPDGLE